MKTSKTARTCILLLVVAGLTLFAFQTLGLAQEMKGGGEIPRVPDLNSPLGPLTNLGSDSLSKLGKDSLTDLGNDSLTKYGPDPSKLQLPETLPNIRLSEPSQTGTLRFAPSTTFRVAPSISSFGGNGGGGGGGAYVYRSLVIPAACVISGELHSSDACHIINAAMLGWELSRALDA